VERWVNYSSLSVELLKAFRCIDAIALVSMTTAHRDHRSGYLPVDLFA
jgi:hypothetical protein